MWSCYGEQKDMISNLLTRVENDLQKIPTKFSTAEQVKAQLASKNELRSDLKRAIDVTLQRLKDLSGYIVTITSADGADVMNEEVNNFALYFCVIYFSYF